MSWLGLSLLGFVALLVFLALLGFLSAVFLLTLIFGVVFLLTLIFYAIRWYEVGRAPEARARLRDISWRAVYQFFLEYLAQLGMLALWVADAVASAYRRFRPREKQATEEAPGERPAPAILVHGLGMRGLTLWPLGRRLRRAGRREVRYFTYGRPARHIPGYAEQLKEAVDGVLREGASEKVDLFCHSMGGLVARFYVSFLGGAERVAHLVTLGTPHGGSGLWCFSLTASGLDLKPGSPLLERLEQAG
ncbi:MAG: esterase/lipase family protein, partial [Nitrospinota bacterium]